MVVNLQEDFFSEYFVLEDESDEEKTEAILYLNLWKKNLLRKIPKECLKNIEETFIFHPEMKGDGFHLTPNMGIKIKFERTEVPLP